MEAQTNSNITCSTERSVVHTDVDTYAKASEVCIAGNLSTQKSEKRTEAECVDSNGDVQDMEDIEKCKLTTYPRSS